jgi:hypothetical protein
VLIIKFCSGDEVVRVEGGVACGRYGRDERPYRNWVWRPEVNRSLARRRRRCKVNFKYIFKLQNAELTGFFLDQVSDTWRHFCIR